MLRKVMITAVLAGSAMMSTAEAATPDADKLFEQGKFAEAMAAYQSITESSEDFPHATRRQASIHLYANRLDVAEILLNKLIGKDPADSKSAALLAEIENRRGNFPAAAKWSTMAGRTARASLYALFGNDAPYQIKMPRSISIVKFMHTDPLPAFEASVNGKTGLFILDTGAADTILDPNFASTIGVERAKSETGTFAGGKTAEIAYGRVKQFLLGEVEISNIPVALVSTAKFSAVHAKPIAGVIGIGVLSKFRSTIDYPKGQLVLDRSQSVTPTAPAAHNIPFWQVGSHYLLALGRVNGGREQMFFADTGLAGFAFTAPESTLVEAGISWQKPQEEKDGGIGTAAVAPIQLRTLSLGTLERQNLVGLFGAFPPPLESGLGVRVGGIISHAFFRSFSVTLDFKHMLISIDNQPHGSR